MKRSEMIKHINEFLEEGIGKPDYSGKRILASQFLSFLESKGMLPPAYDKFIKAEGLDGIIKPTPEAKLYYKIPCHEWESENDQH